MKLTDWVNQVEVLRKKVEGNPFGKVTAGILIPKDCGLTQDVFQVSLGDTPSFQLNGSEADNTNLKSLFKDNRVLLEKLLNSLTTKVADLETSTDKMLSVMVTGQIPGAILARMEGASDGYSNQELMLKSTEEDMKTCSNRFQRAQKQSPIKSIELTKSMKVELDGETADWDVSINIDTKVQRIDIGPFYCKNGSFWGNPGIKDNLLFLLHRKELLAAMDSLINYLEAAKQI